MKETDIIDLLQNIAILLAFTMLYENFWLKNEVSKRLWSKIITGLFLGGIGIVLILTPWTLSPGILIDSRSILLSISGLFFGPIPTITAMLLTGFFRVVMGGDGMWMGIAVIISSGTIGLLWRQIRASWRQKNVFIELFAMGVIVYLARLGCAFLLPRLSADIILIIKTTALPLFLLDLPGIILLGFLMLRQSSNFQNRLSILKEITERKRAEESLEESKKTAERYLNVVAEIILSIDTLGNITLLNDSGHQLLGYNPGELIGKNWFKTCLPYEMISEVSSVIEKLKNGDIEKVVNNENVVKTKSGEIRTILWHNTLLKDLDGNITGLISSGEDFTERKKTDRLLLEKNEEYQQINEELSQTNIELIKAKEHAEESDHLKSAFLANMSHEIRTPMNGILGFADLLEDQGFTVEERHEYIKIIKKSGVRMLNIINDLIDISKVESGQMEISNSETNVNEQIEYIYTFFKLEAERKGLQIFFQNGLPVKEAVIETDREKIYAILTNLVKNAIKYSDKGTIEFGYNLKNKYLEFFIKDTGIGIPHDKKEVIFDRFIQADIADTRAFQGAGLGLAISKAYVEMLGGEIWVESESGKGSTFYFTIPYNDELQERNVIENIVPAEETENQIKNLKILIAEDDETSEMLLTKIITQDYKDVLHVKTGVEAVEACLQHPDIDLVLMDIQMPEMNGYEATRQIRQFNKEVIIIAQTAYALYGEKEKALAVGCTDYISKPLSRNFMGDLMIKYFSEKIVP